MKGTRLWLVIAMIAGLLATALVAGCGDDEEESGSSDSSGSTDTADLGLIEDGTLIIGSDIPFPPFEQGDPPEYEGFDIDLINAVAEKLELETQIEDAPFDLILTGGGGQFDLSISATTITPARENRVDFSDPYFISSQGLLVAEGSDIASIDDITSDTIVGAEDGTTGETFANDNSDAGEVRQFPAVDDAFNALSVGQVDAVIADGPTVEDAAANKEGLEVVEIFPTDEEYGIVLPEGNEALVEAVNEALQEVKDEGTLDELYEQYFEVPAPEELSTATHEAS
jgi:polar amino acid transport system substrate-binding protein